MRKPLVLVAALVAAAVLSAGCSATPYAAVVNGSHIRQSDLHYELDVIKGNKAYAQQLDSNGQGQLTVEGSSNNQEVFGALFTAQVLRRQILLEVVHQEVARLHLPVGPDAIAEAQQTVQSDFGDTPDLLNAFPRHYRDLLIRREAEVAVLGTAVSATKTDARAIQDYYNAHQTDFATTCVRHILVDNQAQAGALRAQLASGADFAALAKANSKDTSSAPKGGDLGCLTAQQASQIVPEFTSAMNKLAVNEISQPVQSSLGYFIIQVTNRSTQSVQDATSQIQSALQSQQSTDLNNYILKTVAASKVMLNPEYGTFDSRTGDVVPPKAPSVALPSNTRSSTDLGNPLSGASAGQAGTPNP